MTGDQNTLFDWFLVHNVQKIFYMLIMHKYKNMSHKKICLYHENPMDIAYYSDSDTVYE